MNAQRLPLLSQCLLRTPRRAGLHALQYPCGELHAGARIRSQRLILSKGEDFETRIEGAESAWVLQQGDVRVELADCVYELARMNVFEERASLVYLPPGANVGVHARSAVEIVVVSTACERRTEPLVVRPPDVRVTPRGGRGYTREVHDLLVNDTCAQHLMVGETFSPPGAWSSFPPHKHDGEDGEPALEEVYHYRIDPACGFALQRLYTAHGQDVTFSVEDGDCVWIPYGYHPVAAAPGYRLYYLWALAGDERKLSLHEDPRHAWIHGA